MQILPPSEWNRQWDRQTGKSIEALLYASLPQDWGHNKHTYTGAGKPAYRKHPFCYESGGGLKKDEVKLLVRISALHPLQCFDIVGQLF